jgi:hypothetical protein
MKKVSINPLNPPILRDLKSWGTPPDPRQEVSCISFNECLSTALCKALTKVAVVCYNSQARPDVNGYGVDTEDEMGRLLLGVPLLVLMLVAGSIACASHEESPKEVVQGYYEAIEAMDEERVAEYLTEDVYSELMPYLLVDFATHDAITFDEMKISIIYETDEMARIEVEYNWETTTSGETNGGHIIQTIDLARFNGKWLIEESPQWEPEKQRLITSELIQLLHFAGGAVIIEGTSLTAIIGNEFYEATISECFNPFEEFRAEIEQGNITINYEDY